MTFKIQPRRALYIYLKNIRHAQQLKKFGRIVYISKKMALVALYVDDDELDKKISHIMSYKFVKKVTTSPRPDIDPDFDNVHDDIFFESYDEQESESQHYAHNSR
ncbi:YlbG family protein [Leuconostoc fallax]|uniref:Uncharacterized protein n=1 Tax=Leuconostoc fallax TaxID=1251 RepID=A0A4R5N7Z2_9LACO|nr:YlbG family protein [Leuconostoc fallax]MBU7455729.1 YlbG family protein [Leuconostoc fallax]TDG68033.1 hypothetical protein C5L23_000339 [Leuconostoc fallax]